MATLRQIFPGLCLLICFGPVALWAGEPPLSATERTAKQVIYTAPVGSGVPEIKIVVRGQNLNDIFAKILAIEIEDAKTGTLLQVIGGLSTTTPHGEIYLEDINFDGYKDLRVQSMIPAGANAPFLYWLYDKQQGKFVRHPELDMIVSPEVDFERQELLSHERLSAAEYLTMVYQWKKGQLTPISKTLTLCQGEKECVKEYYTLQNGQWQKTLALPATINENTTDILYTLAQDHLQCKQILKSHPIEPKSEAVLAARENYVRCLEEIFVKAAQTFYPTQTFGSDPQATIQVFNQTVGNLYENMVLCKNQADCAYYEAINAKMNAANVMDQVLANMLLAIGSSAKDFNPNDWQDAWYQEP